ncbi:MAG: MBL fold metallo-hydrolase [Bacteroidota bacterium]
MTEPIRIELPTIYGMKTVNAYLFLTPEPTLIDCGEKTDASWNALEKALQKHQLTIADIKKVIITHAHVDHIGMAGRIVVESGATVWVNDYCYDWAVHKDRMWQQRTKMMQQYVLGDMPPGPNGKNFKKMMLSFMAAVMQAWDTVPAENVQTFPIDGQLEIGGTTWQVIYAPGHTNRQTCFYQKEKKWLMGADMLLKITPTPVIEFSVDDFEKRDNGLAMMLDSYERMRNLDIEKVFPGHYEPFDDHRRLIDAQVRRIQQRKEATYGLIAEGKNRFYELFDVLYANRMNMPGMSMLRGYLDLLRDENRIVETVKDGYNFYRVVTGD